MTGFPLFIVVAWLAAADMGNPNLRQAQAHYEGLRYAEAIKELEIARRAPGTTVDEKLRIFELLGCSLVAEGRRVEAERAFGEMLLLEPHAQLDRSLSPKILEAFDAAKLKRFPNGYVALEKLPASPGLARVRVVDPWTRVESLRLFRRPKGQPRFESQELSVKQGVATADLASESAPATEWYAEAQDGMGEPLAQLGSARSPLLEVGVRAGALAPSMEASGKRDAHLSGAPQWKKPVVIATAAAAVAAAGAGAYFQARSLASARDAQAAPRVEDARSSHDDAVREARWSAGLFVGAGLAGATATVLFLW